MRTTATLRRLMRSWFGDCRGSAAAAFRREYRALERRLGPFDEGVVRYAAGAVVLGLEFQTVTSELRTAQDARAHGKGRRPSTAQIARLRKRQGLVWGDYDRALARLDTLAKAQPAAGDLMRRLVSGGAR